ncbi:MAG: hypothetical protein IT348_04260 [Candidatus Eisenbacteria bacterium]|nr:hypothetical protein [Candidatus Eisenbacteria bacterium]
MLGAPLFSVSRSNAELTVGRRVSPRSEVLAFVAVSASKGEQDTDLNGVTQVPYRYSPPDGFSVEIGPGLRRYVQPSANFSAFGSLLVTGRFSKSTVRDVQLLGRLATRTRTRGASASWSCGGEYFTPWSASFAVESEIVRADFNDERTEQEGFDPVGPVVVSTWTLKGMVHVAPQVLLRVHF